MPRAARVPLLGAAVCAVLLVATGCLTFLSASFRARDAASLDGFMALERSRLGPQTGMWAHLVDPPVYGLAALVLIGLGLHFHGRRNAVVIAMVLIGSGVTTKILKTVLDVPRPSDLLFKQVAAVSWPSGHATAALSLAICLVLAVPPARRPLAALVGAPFAIVVSYSTLVQGWHFPSDTIGGRASGTWIFQKRSHRLAPSTRAASLISGGMVMKCARIQYTAKGIYRAISGSAIARRVFRSPSWRSRK